LTLGDGLNRGVDGAGLVVARVLAAAVRVVVLGDRGQAGTADALPGAVALPQLGRGRERIHGKLMLRTSLLARPVVFEEAVAI